ncbi:MAG: S8 family serine peptidase [Saprospiraceae bacterium]|nr:S8 family serine peptidase [Saprospiraceae bacterium]
MLSFCILILGLWIIFRDREGVFRLFSVLILAGLIGLITQKYLQSSDYTELSLELAKSLFFLAAIGYLLQFLKQSSIAQFGILFIGLYLSWGLNADSKEASTVNSPLPDQNGEFLIQIEKRNLSDVTTWSYALDAKIKRAFHPSQPDITSMDDYYILDIKQGTYEEIASKLASNTQIEWVENNEVIPFEFPAKSGTTTKDELNTLSNDPSVALQWHLQHLGMSKYLNYFSEKALKPTKKAKLFILDTGIDKRHEDLSVNSINAAQDKQGHGTHCAGVAAAITNNKIGVASFAPSVDWVEVHGIQVIGDIGFGTQVDIINGIIQATDAGADVISMSLGGITNQEREKAYNEAVRYANQKGTIVVVAAGNANLDGKRYSPANAENVIVVTSLNQNDEKSGFSNHVSNIAMGISAPGENIFSTTPSNTYTPYSGTSMAAPQVAGLVAVIKAIRPELDTKKIYSILSRTGKETKNTLVTGKLIQPYEAIQLLIAE